MSHTSGMANISEDYRASLADRVVKYPKTPLNNQPGTKFTYVNAGINTVGRIVEVVSGEPYETFIQQRILTPLGMKDTTFWPSPEQLARLATGYQADAKGEALVPAPNAFLSVPGKAMVRAHPAGGLFSTADDLLKFCRMLLDGGTYEGRTYISQSSIDLMTKLYTTPDTGGSYGLGWMISHNSFGHDGAWKTRMTIEPRDGLVEIFLVQLSKPYMHPEADHIAGVFTTTADKTFRTAPAPAPAAH
jgi:CubicO group peptidase (beta-lactamase class C family)